MLSHQPSTALYSLRLSVLTLACSALMLSCADDEQTSATDATDATTTSDTTDAVDTADSTDGTDTTDGTDGTDSIDGMDGTDTSEPLTCLETVTDALVGCVIGRSSATTSCYSESDAACEATNADLTNALTSLESSVRERCTDNEFGNLSVDDLVGRLRNSCVSESDSLAWRVFGGPQGAVWSGADADTKTCLVATHTAGLSYIETIFTAVTVCTAQGTCEPSEIAEVRQAAKSTTIDTIANACPALGNVIAISPEVYLERVAHQADCIAAAGVHDTSGLELTCGPSHAQFTGKRGEWVQVIIDSEKFGTLCGDGSDYAFWINLAPAGEPLDRVFIGLQGGGVCVFEEDCSGKPAGLFTAMDDMPLGAGIASDDPEVSPYANWTRVYLPYCTQDVFAGGGATEELGDLSLPRYGSVNLRAAVRMVRDVLWKEMDAAEGPGFRSDQLIAMLGGWSAGGYGTIYNYHWMLDDLLWPRTIAFPDAGLALDNGELLGVAGLGLVKIPAWGTKSFLPPYCFQGECAVGPTLYNALSPRLKQVPEQQMMILTNPLDDIQMNDAYFDDRVFWLNTMRSAYCETRDLPGINYYFTSVSDESIHVVTLRDELWNGEVDGETMKDWLWGAVTAPDDVVSRVEEGDFSTVFPGVNPYPCDVAP